jgi:hypothetical protein
VARLGLSRSLAQTSTAAGSSSNGSKEKGEKSSPEFELRGGAALVVDGGDGAVPLEVLGVVHGDGEDEARPVASLAKTGWTTASRSSG